MPEHVNELKYSMMAESGKRLALIVMVFLVSNFGPAHSIEANFTIGDTVTAEVEKRVPAQNVTVLPFATLERSISTASNLRGNSYFIDSSTSPLTRAELEIYVSKNTSDYGAKNIRIAEYTGLAHILPPDFPVLTLPDSHAPLGIFVKIEAPAGMDWALLKLKYTLDELAIGIEESSIYIIGYDEASNKWARPESVGGWATAAGVNVREHYAWVNLSRFSIYGIAGALTAAPKTGPAVIPEMEIFERPAAEREMAARVRTYGVVLAFLLFLLFLALKLRR